MDDVTRVAALPRKPVMVFDGDCNFCQRWIARWRQETGDRIEYLAFQEPVVAERFPEIPRAQFETAVQLIESDGRAFSGAEAVFRSLACVRRWPLWAYEHVPGAAPVTERAYRFVAEHRVLFSRVTTLLWGREVELPAYQVVRWVFLRLLAVIYLIAFLSLWTQVKGLIGEDGILPAKEYMQSLEHAVQERQIGLSRYLLVPTLCWGRADDAALQWQCGAGVVLSVFVLVGLAPAPSLFLLWLIYLSLTTIGRIFLGYQWDNLLLETGFLAIFFAPVRLWPKFAREMRPSAIVLWLLRWLLFRLMFSSGCVKLLSGDPTWHNLTALSYHYETQPLPTWIGWYVFQFPAWVHRASTFLMFAVELAVPFLIIFPRRLRLIAFWLFVALELLIALTGNYCFFNLLTIALCILLLDDRALLKWAPKRWRQQPERTSPENAPGVQRGGSRLQLARRIVFSALAVVVLLLTLVPMFGLFHFWPRPLLAVHQWAEPFRSFNGYGLFAVMTTSRPEIVVEGSLDGNTWLPYEFKYKAGDVKRRPAFVAPHQPRLDWQMWFAALGDVRQNPWFIQFCHRLLTGAPEVLALLQSNPFPNAPPKYVRATLYDYHFTDFATRRATSAWWKRELKGQYCPPLSLEIFRVR